jgi:hypothetical protein
LCSLQKFLAAQQLPRWLALFACCFFLLLNIVLIQAQTPWFPQLGPAPRASLGSGLTVRGVVANGPELGGMCYLLDQAVGLFHYAGLCGPAARPQGGAAEHGSATIMACWS